MVDAAAQVLVSTDLLIIPHGFVEDLSHQDLYRDEWVCLVAADNTDVGESLTVEQLKTMPWPARSWRPCGGTPCTTDDPEHRYLRDLILRATAIMLDQPTSPGPYRRRR